MKRPLDRYAEKRSFTRTPEPGPDVPAGRRGPLLFIVQKHAATRLHYDFRLEFDGVLKSWAVPKGPSLVLGDKRLAVEVEDHPFEYASFEGVIPEKQYGAGNVIVWDCGVYSPDEDEEYSFDDRARAEARMRAGLTAGKLSFFMRGEKLKGSFTLVRTKTDKQWLLMKHKDRFAGASDLLARSASVLTGRTLDDTDNAPVPQHFDATKRVPGQLPAVELVPHGPAEALPKKFAPMLAEPADGTPGADSQWLFEPKLDGYRVVAFVDKGKVELRSRNDLDLTPGFPEIVADLRTQLVETMLLDGEIIALGADGRPSFNALQNRRDLKTEKELAVAMSAAPAVLVCFDLLHFAGLNLRGSRYVDRRRYLAQCLLTTPHLQLMHAAEDGAALFEVAVDGGYEGVIGKRKDSLYQVGKRSSLWRKYKNFSSLEFVIGGYTKGRNDREPLGSLILGYWKDNELHYAGNAGSGLTDESVKYLLGRMSGLVRKTHPFAAKPDSPQRSPTWVAPELVAEVRFDSWTPTQRLRFPIFVKLRDDVSARTVRGGPEAEGKRDRAKVRSTKKARTPSDQIGEVLQQLDGASKNLDLNVDGRKLHVTNLDREYWPADSHTKAAAVTKRELLKYLAAVSPYMLPHLRDRPLTMIRMPEGIHGERFFQKHMDQARPDWVEVISLWSGTKETQHEYVVGKDLPTLLWLGQLGTLEFHVWHSRAKVAADSVSKETDYATAEESLDASVLNYPDYLVFDIDPYIYSGKEKPGEEPELNRKGFAVGRRVAFWINDLLKQMSLSAVVKTSGKTGLHVFVPIERTVTFDESRQICEMVGRHVMREHPKDITMEWAVVKRTGKIFIDYNMNVRGKTLNVAYSPRGVPGAPVSMPLTWEELEAAQPMDFTIRNVIARLEKTGDRWHDALLRKHSLTQAFGSIERT